MTHRQLAAVLAESLGQPVVVVNRAGASGNLGASEAARSAADGYTMLFSPGSTMISNPFLFSQMPFDAERDLLPLASVARLSLFLMVHPSVPANNVQELVAHIRANPTRLNYGSNGQGSSPHLAAEMMLRQAGLQASHVPYRGTAPALAALLKWRDSVHVRLLPWPAPCRRGPFAAFGRGQPGASSTVSQRPHPGGIRLPRF